jgi:hypothetical protein
MAFPTNPVNNQTYNDGTYTYKYNSTFRTWTKIAQTTANIGNVVTVTGNVTGNLAGNVTGNLAGNVSGNLTGNVSGNVTGNITGNVSGNITGNVSGNITGNVSGNVTGNSIVVGNTNISNGNISIGNTSLNESNLTIGTTVVSNNNITLGTTSLTNSQVSANYLVASQGCVSISTSSIQVSGSDAGIFNINVGNINLGLVASNITFGAASSNSTFRGNLISNNYSTTGNVTTTNIKTNKIISNGNSVSIATGTVIDSFAIADYRSAKYTIRAGSDIGYQAVEVLLVHDDINSIVTVYGSLSTAGVDLVTLSTQIVSGNVQLSATALTANTNLNLIGTYVPD